MTDLTPEWAAKRMTAAQKRKLLSIGNGQPAEYPLHASGLYLIERGMVFVNELGARRLTDFGQKVRAFLEARP